MKSKLIIFLFCIIFTGRTCAKGASAHLSAKPSLPNAQQAVPSPVQPQPVDFSSCNKNFKIDAQKLFYLSLASANANRFKIEEIQSKSGYLLFSVAQKEYLASVISIDSKNSMIKITPCNNNYYFPIGIVQNFFKYIELNLNTPVEKLIIN